MQIYIYVCIYVFEYNYIYICIHSKSVVSHTSPCVREDSLDN